MTDQVKEIIISVLEKKDNDIKELKKQLKEKDEEIKELEDGYERMVDRYDLNSRLYK